MVIIKSAESDSVKKCPSPRKKAHSKPPSSKKNPQLLHGPSWQSSWFKENLEILAALFH
jgi:hypothetical protein